MSPCRVLTALLLAGGAARANPADVYGFGARGAAMGGAQAALAQDSSAGYYNPAGLARGRTLQLDFGYRAAAPSFNINGAPSAVTSLSGFLLGLVIPSEVIAHHRLAFGLALAVPQGRLFKFRSTANEVPRVLYYDNRPQRLFLAGNVAIEILPGLHLGGGIATLSRSQGHVTLEGNVALSQPLLSSLASSVDVGLFGVRYPQAGIAWEPSERLEFGLTYRHSFQLAIDQNFRIEGSVGDPGQKPLVEKGYFEAQTRIRDLFQPAQLTAGVAARPTGNLLVTADLTWARWSQFPEHVPLGILIELGPLLDPLLNLPPPHSAGPPGFKDLLIPRAGAEWRVREAQLSIDLRAGYSYEASPVPEQTGETNQADGSKHTLSGGVGFELRGLAPVLAGALSLDLYGAFTLIPERVDHKTGSAAVLRSNGSVLQAGAMTRLRF